MAVQCDECGLVVGECENDKYASNYIAELEQQLELTKALGDGFSAALMQAEQQLQALKAAVAITHSWLMSDTVFNDFGQIEFYRAELAKVIAPPQQEG